MSSSPPSILSTPREHQIVVLSIQAGDHHAVVVVAEHSRSSLSDDLLGGSLEGDRCCGTATAKMNCSTDSTAELGSDRSDDSFEARDAPFVGVGGSLEIGPLDEEAGAFFASTVTSGGEDTRAGGGDRRRRRGRKRGAKEEGRKDAIHPSVIRRRKIGCFAFSLLFLLVCVSALVAVAIANQRRNRASARVGTTTAFDARTIGEGRTGHDGGHGNPGDPIGEPDLDSGSNDQGGDGRVSSELV